MLNSKNEITNYRKIILSTLWIFLSVNYIFCDVLSLMESKGLNEFIKGSVGGIEITQGFLLIAGISLEIPFVMIILSRILKHNANRWFNILAGLLMTIYQIGSFTFGTAPTLHYIFFSIVEISCNLFIVWYAWNWKSA